MKTFTVLIDNQQKICYNAIVILLQIQPKEAMIMMNLYLSDVIFVACDMLNARII